MEKKKWKRAVWNTNEDSKRAVKKKKRPIWVDVYANLVCMSSDRQHQMHLSETKKRRQKHLPTIQKRLTKEIRPARVLRKKKKINKRKKKKKS